MKMKNTQLSVLLILIIFLAAGCTKEVPKEMQNTNKQAPPITQQSQMPDDDIHKNLKNQNQTTDTDTTSSKGDDKAEKLIKEADDADTKYQKSKSDADKMTCITKQLTAANYLMFEANLSPKKKYKPALQRYRRVLELDPSNKEANENKQQIEDIYKSMGMPIPE
jgi:hypothetical protein